MSNYLEHQKIIYVFGIRESLIEIMKKYNMSLNVLEGYLTQAFAVPDEKFLMIAMIENEFKELGVVLSQVYEEIASVIYSGDQITYSYSINKVSVLDSHSVIVEFGVS